MTLDYDKIILDGAKAMYKIRPFAKVEYKPPVENKEYGSIVYVKNVFLTWEECFVDIDGMNYCQVFIEQSKAAFAAMQDNLPAISEYEEPIDIADELYNELRTLGK